MGSRSGARTAIPVATRPSRPHHSRLTGSDPEGLTWEGASGIAPWGGHGDAAIPLAFARGRGAGRGLGRGSSRGGRTPDLTRGRRHGERRRPRSDAPECALGASARRQVRSSGGMSVEIRAAIAHVEGSQARRWAATHADAEQLLPLTLPSPLLLRPGCALGEHGERDAERYAANFRSLMASKSCTPPPTRLVV